jgi:RES domain-containing protein
VPEERIVKRHIYLAAVIAAAVCLAAPAFAHHSASMFDDAKVVEKKGIVKELQWTNPHVWLQIVVEENGKKTEWSFEGGSPNTLSRQGWRATTFKSGDAVTVRFNPMKDGSAAGLFIGAKFDADGKTIGRW